MPDRTVTLNGEEYTEVELYCPEPGCDGRLRLKLSRYGVFYGCCNWKLNECPGGHGAHQSSGKPHGTPIAKVDKPARRAAHAVFDKLWKTKTMSRGAAYRWMQRALEMPAIEAHISKFDRRQCRRLVLAFKAEFPELWEESWDRK